MPENMQRRKGRGSSVKRTALLLLLVSVLVFITSSCLDKIPGKEVEPPDIVWQKCLGGSENDYAHAIRQTADGGYIVAGATWSNDGDVSGNNGGTDFWVVKLDAFGSIVWQKCLGGSQDEIAYDVQQTTDGGYIVVGTTTSDDGDVIGTSGTINTWVVKLDSSGNLGWQKSLGGRGSDYAHSVDQTTDGGYIVAGSTSSNEGDVSGNKGGGDVWVFKLDNLGNLLWQKCLGGSEDDAAWSIQQTTDDGYIVAGMTRSNDGDVSGNNGSADFWVVKLDSAGNILWQKCLGGSNTDFARSARQTSDGGYIVVGFTQSNDGNVAGFHGDRDAWVVKLDTLGNLLWQKCFGGTGKDEAWSVEQNSDGSYVIAGGTSSNNGDVTGNNGGTDAWVVKLDASGALVWQRCMGGSDLDFAFSILANHDGSYVVAGYTRSDDGDVIGKNEGDDAWIVKLK